MPGRDLRIERLGGGDAHFDVAPIGGIEHPVRLLYEVAVAPVDYRDYMGTPARTRSTVRFVSVVVPDWLIATTSIADMSSGNPAPEGPQPDSSVADHRLDRDIRQRFGDRRAYRLAGHRCGPLADHRNVVDPAGRKGLPERPRYDVVPQAGNKGAIFSRYQFPAQGLAHRRRRLGDLFQQKMAEAAAVDVPRCYFGHFDVRLADRLCGAVVAQAGDPGKGAGTASRAA